MEKIEAVARGGIEAGGSDAGSGPDGDDPGLVAPPPAAARAAGAAPIGDAALGAWADFLRFHAVVTDVLGRELADAVHMPLPWFDVLTQLDAAPGGRLRMQDLAAAVVLSRSGLTRLVDRLVEVGCVVRTSCPTDRRGTFAEITADGRAKVRDARPTHLRGVAAHFAAHLTEPELTTFAHAMATLLAAHGVETGTLATGCRGGAGSGLDRE